MSEARATEQSALHAAAEEMGTSLDESFFDDDNDADSVQDDEEKGLNTRKMQDQSHSLQIALINLISVAKARALRYCTDMLCDRSGGLQRGLLLAALRLLLACGSIAFLIQYLSSWRHPSEISTSLQNKETIWYDSLVQASILCVWIFHKESGDIKRQLFWIVSVLCLGAGMTLAYLAIQFSKITSQDDLMSVLFRECDAMTSARHSKLEPDTQTTSASKSNATSNDSGVLAEKSTFDQSEEEEEDEGDGNEDAQLIGNLIEL